MTLSRTHLVPPVAADSVDGVFAKEDWIAVSPKPDFNGAGLVHTGK